MPAAGANSSATLAARGTALAASVAIAAGAFELSLLASSANGFQPLDLAPSLFILISTWWLAWGAAQGVMGLFTRARPPAGIPQDAAVTARTVILMPICNEDPAETFARIAAIDTDIAAAGATALFDIAVLSDTRDPAIAQRERLWFARLLRERDGAGRMFYRARAVNTGRKAGNIEDFIRTSGAAWDFAVILDADSLMAADTLVELVRRMQAGPDLGLIQTLPRVVGARSRFGRAMQFSAAMHAPVFARGLAMMQGGTGPFWGHNAIVRIRAFAESCGLPALSGPPPFGGHILSHDYVEAALLARNGWRVRLDDDLGGSFEEGPENIIDHARRDRRWCQGNLQHARLLAAPGLKGWSRFVFFQGIMAYVAPLFWIAFLASAVAAAALAPPPDYFPYPDWPTPVFRGSRTTEAVGLAVGIFGLLVLPKLLVALAAAVGGRAGGFGGGVRAVGSALAELLFSAVAAPVLLAFQTRAVLHVLMGRDSGWPPNNRGDGSVGFAQAWAAAWWIVAAGALGLAMVGALAPDLVWWLIPVGVPMLAAPAIIWWSSHPGRGALMRTPEETTPPRVVALFAAIRAAWTGGAAAEPAAPAAGRPLPA